MTPARLILACRPLLVLLALCATAAPAAGQADDEEQPDPRYTGYADRDLLIPEPPSNATNYLLLAGLGVLVVGVTFKNARRTHLD